MLTNPSKTKDEFTSVPTGSLNEDESKTKYEFSDIGDDRC